MNYFDYQAKKCQPRKIHLRIVRIEKKIGVRLSELDANRGLRFAAEMVRAERDAMIRVFTK